MQNLNSMTSEKPHYEIADEFTISDLDTLKKLTHPQRVDILHTLQTPKTVKEIAAEIDADPTKLYYHIRQMEQIKAIQVVETNIVSGIVEKKYLITAHSYQVREDLFSGDEAIDYEVEFPKIMDAVFRSTINQAKRSAKAGLVDMKKPEEGKPISVAIMSMDLSLNEEQLVEFDQRMQALLDDFAPKPGQENSEKPADEDSKTYVFTLAFFERSTKSES